LELPPFKSSAFRGGFGHVFKRLTCAYPGHECDDCQIQHSCPYVYVFETKPPSDSKVLKNFENVPRPYVIATRFDDTKTYFKMGDRLSFDLFLIGDALQYIPFFIHSFELLGLEGIGKQRRPYRLARVEALDSCTGMAHQIYEGRSKRIRQKDVSVTGSLLMDRAESLQAKTVRICFETPLRMKWKGVYTSDPQFHLLLRNAVRRVTSLLYFHLGGKEISMDFGEFFKRAESVEMIETNVKWVDWERYSARQNDRMNFGGIIGEAEYRGDDLQPFIPWLLAAEALGMGKQTAFGLGRIRLVWSD